MKPRGAKSYFMTGDGFFNIKNERSNSKYVNFAKQRKSRLYLMVGTSERLTYIMVWLHWLSTWEWIIRKFRIMKTWIASNLYRSVQEQVVFKFRKNYFQVTDTYFISDLKNSLSYLKIQTRLKISCSNNHIYCNINEIDLHTILFIDSFSLNMSNS